MLILYKILNMEKMNKLESEIKILKLKLLNKLNQLLLLQRLLQNQLQQQKLEPNQQNQNMEKLLDAIQVKFLCQTEDVNLPLRLSIKDNKHLPKLKLKVNSMQIKNLKRFIL